MARWRRSNQSGMHLFNAVSHSLEAMGVEQYLMAFLFLGSYTMSLSQFSGAQGRRYAVGAALGTAMAFIARSDRWENGLLVVAFALIAIGGLAAAVWGLWALLERFAHPLSPERPGAP
jgi:hypothetical protein